MGGWIAFIILPCSSRFNTPADRRSRGIMKTKEQVELYCCCCPGVKSRGGRLANLLWYDMATFTFSTGIFAAVPQMHNTARRAKVGVYWCKVLYSLLSLPFVLFVLPVCSWMLTHCTFTGYNVHGA